VNNPIRDVLYANAAPLPPGSPAAAVGSATPGAGAAVGAPHGARVQIGITCAFVVAVAVLVLLNRAGFKFSVTVG
jgi:hypothetical protein